MWMCSLGQRSSRLSPRIQTFHSRSPRREHARVQRARDCLKATDASSLSYEELSRRTSTQRETSGARHHDRDYDVIRRWAERRKAEPATGEATASGPATIDVNDGGARIRCNCPGAATISSYHLGRLVRQLRPTRFAVVYEEEVDLHANAHSGRRARGGPGGDREDWFEADCQPGGPKGAVLARYRIIKRATEVGA
jgi:hypothetical protein